MSPHNAALYEVYYQDLPESEVEKDIVFSLGEAEEAVLDFYNDCIQKYLSDQVEPLESYEEVAMLQTQYARQLKGKAWFEIVEETATSDVADESEVIVEATATDNFVSLFDELNPNFFTNLTENLRQNLRQKKVVLTPSEIHQIVSDALWRDVTEVASHSRNQASLQRSSAANPHVYLILVKDNDAAVYFGTEYIDAADQANDDDLQAIVDTAQMLSEKYQTQVITHHFAEMPDNWSWAMVEGILKTSGIMPSEKPSLLTVLRDIESLRLSINVQANVQAFQYCEEAFEDYVKCGDGSQVVFVIDTLHQFEDDQILLTVEEVVKAIEISTNHWVCGDLFSTELFINPRKYFNTSLANLIR